ncbi:lysine--tRNA ligase [Candidatus Woesearchaeota archaeon]|nr:lysine--tRNA ligase [Candidatus Woesearchaeota archaeon]
MKLTKEEQEEKQEEEVLHWADQIADAIIDRVAHDPQLQQITKEKGYICFDEKTPSGKIHVGSGRGWIIHDVVAKALRSRGVRGRFILSSDDIDPFDKMNADLPQHYEQYLGMPFRNIPSPFPGYKSFAAYYFQQCTDKFAEFGIVAELESTGEMYDKGLFNRTIKIALDHASEIQAIYAKLYGEDAVGAKKLPFNPICQNCGKIGTTLTLAWDPKQELVTYVCQENLVPWAKGCGYRGKISPYHGKGKFPWKVEWAAKWPSVGVVYETAGKDHFTQGGSRTIACMIATDVFHYPSPLPSESYRTGKGYEFFTIGGKKMSTSKGQGIGFAEVTDYIPAPIVRYLLVRTRPNAVIDFDPYGTNDVILLYERYDKTMRCYYGKEPEESVKEVQKQRRIFELAAVDEIPKEMPPQIAFTLASSVVQSKPSFEEAITTLQRMGHLPQQLSGEAKEMVKERLQRAKKWVEKFADKQFVFQVHDSVPQGLQLQEKERTALHALAETLKQYTASQAYNEKVLFEEIYTTARTYELSPQELFRAAYLVLIGKEKGPRLAPFILTIGVEKAIALFANV